MWKVSSCASSSGVNLACVSAGRYSATNSTASSTRYTDRGATASSRRASRPTTTAATRNVATPPAITKPRVIGSKESDPDALGQQLAVVGRVAEQQLGGLRPLEVEVRRVLPGEADATVDLDVLGRGVEVGVGAVGLGQRGHGGELVVQLRGAPTGVVGGRLGRLDLEQHVGALVLDGLERADGPTELHAVLGVLHGGLEAHLGPADLLGGEADGGEVEHGGEGVPAGTVGADEGALDAGQLELGLLAGLVHGGQRGAGESGGVTGDREQADAGGGAGGHDDHVGGVAVDHVGL